MAPPRALFRPDALAGFGHLARTLALATAWTRAGGTVDVDASGIDDTWRRRFETIGATFDGAARSDWCVLDGYGNDLAVQRRARVDHDHVLVIDDHGSLGGYDADLVLDHNIGADRGDLLGSRYLLLRTEFAAEPPDRPSLGRRVLLAPGGAPSSSTTGTFEGIAAGLTAAGADVVWLRGVDDVVATMASADVAVAAAGSPRTSCAESACRQSSSPSPRTRSRSLDDSTTPAPPCRPTTPTAWTARWRPPSRCSMILTAAPR